MTKEVIKESLCGWCGTNLHKVCRGVTQRFYISTTGKDKGNVVFIPNEYNSCNCPAKHKRPDVRNIRPIETIDVNLEVL